MKLRDYQQTAIAAVLAEPRPVCLVAPCGAGKSIMAMEILAQTQGPALFVVHRRELLKQATRWVESFGLKGRVRVATVQGLIVRDERPEAETLVIDECHTILAEEWVAIPQAYPHARIVGITATPQRQDGVGLGGVFKAMIVAADIPELTAAGYLVPCVTMRPDAELERGLAMDPLDAYLKHGESRSGFVFVSRITEAKRLADRFNVADVPALAISSETEISVRDDALGDLAAGRVRLLVNVNCLVAGIDVPSASVCVIARGIGHATNYLQIVGRIMRPAPGKQNGLLLDLPGTSHSHGEPGEARTYMLAGRGIRRAADAITTCLHCGASYESGPLACPVCEFVRPTTHWRPLKIYSLALEAAYRGRATPDAAMAAEWWRLRRLALERGYGLSWAIGAYRKLFGSAPDLSDVTAAEKQDVLVRFRTEAQRKGYRPAYALARYRKLFGSWPPR